MKKTHAAAKKYGISSALTLFRTYCTSMAPVITTENAFLALFLAFDSGLKEEAHGAAWLSLSVPLAFEPLNEELCNASGFALEVLWRHRVAALRAFIEGFTTCRIEFGDIDLRNWSPSRLSLYSTGSHDRISPGL
jgi:hypothetical protein